MNVLLDTPARGRTTPLRIALAVWCVCISLGAVLDHVVLSNLTSQVGQGASRAQVADTEQRLSERIAQAEQAAQRHATELRSRYAAEHDALAARMDAAERTISARANTDRPSAEPPSTLIDRLAQLEARVAALQVRRAAPTRPDATTPAAKPTLPFRIVGIERRGEQRFLSIMPLDTADASQVHLLHTGDTEKGWQLQAIDDIDAVFVRDGAHRRVAVPQRQEGM